MYFVKLSGNITINVISKGKSTITHQSDTQTEHSVMIQYNGAMLSINEVSIKLTFDKIIKKYVASLKSGLWGGEDIIGGG